MIAFKTPNRVCFIYLLILLGNLVLVIKSEKCKYLGYFNGFVVTH